MDKNKILKSLYLGEIEETEEGKKYVLDFTTEKGYVEIENYNINYKNCIESIYIKYNSIHLEERTLVLELKNDFKIILTYNFNHNKFEFSQIEERIFLNGKGEFDSFYDYSEYEESLLKEYEIKLNIILKDFYNFLLKDEKLRLKLILNNPLEKVIV